MNYLPQEIIRHKRDGAELSKQEIDFFVQGITEGYISEGQIGALAMATFFRGMSRDETTALTMAMKTSGKVLDWSKMDLNGPVLDKHSTGGVGDKISLMLGPIIAACGGYVPMISGRGLGHTGGTFDKFETIPGYNATPDFATFQKVTKQVGCAIIGQTPDIAPADRRVYATRDITATVESIPLITASILSKKLAAGLEGLVMDIKFGNGAFADNMEMAEGIAESIVAVSPIPTSAIITDMNQVIGHAAGHVTEVIESIEYLKGDHLKEPLMHDVVVSLCSELLCLGKLADNHKEAAQKIEQVLANGAAAEKFAQMVSALGGPNDLMDNPDKYMKHAPLKQAVFADTAGYVQSMNSRDIGLSIIQLGGGRKVASDVIDHSVGYADFCKIGDVIDSNTPLATVYANDEDSLKAAVKTIKNSIKISAEQVKTPQAIIKTV
ncbi:thymidine phosphorylase [Marinicella rhabdoformis]|uniref:thymidine phosphorylase n=1 Tax=Marinicella rhabdoformis TaxID=2580566 RepID=UPI0012AEC319|nr:thymidine phosphorylase [Marinicella rhabdoformis]